MTFGNEKNREISVGMFMNDPKLIVPVLSDHKAHWCTNRLSFAYVFNISTHQELMLGFNHNDLHRFDRKVLSPLVGKDTFALKKKYLYGLPNWESMLDIEMVHWFATNERFYYEVDRTVKRYWSDFRNTPNVNDFIPIMRHLETCRSVKDNILTQLTSITISESLIRYQKISDNLSEIEMQGLYVKEA
jgi:hypothetical protein